MEMPVHPTFNFYSFNYSDSEWTAETLKITNYSKIYKCPVLGVRNYRNVLDVRDIMRFG